MKLKDALLIGLLIAGCPLLLFGSLLSGRVACEIQGNQAIPRGYKSDAYLLMVLAGLAQGVAAVQLIREIAKREDNDQGDGQTSPVINGSPTPIASLPAATTQAVDFEQSQSQPEYVLSNSFGQTQAIAPTAGAIAATTAPTPKAVIPATPDIIKRLAATRLSIVFSSPPGTGKTTTELAWMANVFRIFPDAMMFIATWKDDPFLGLNQIPGVVAVIGEDEDGEVDFAPLLRQINQVGRILTERLKTPKDKRHIYDQSPVWLVLGDYYVTVNILSKSKKHKDTWESLQTKLGKLIVLGREVNVGIGVDTHSFNTRALGIDDGNIRDCINVCALGKITRSPDGREDGGYGAILKAIGNKLIVDDDAVRSKLLNQELPRLQQESDRTGRPVLFTTMGHPPSLVLLEDLRPFESFQLPPHILSRFAQKLGVDVAVQAQSSMPVSETSPQPPQSPDLSEPSAPFSSAIDLTDHLLAEMQERQRRIQDYDRNRIEPSSPVEPIIEPDDDPNDPFRLPPELSNFFQGEEFDESEPISSSSTELPIWFVKMPDQVKKALYESVRSNRTEGKSRTWIIKNTLNCKSEKYAEGAAVYDELIRLFGAI